MSKGWPGLIGAQAAVRLVGVDAMTLLPNVSIKLASRQIIAQQYMRAPASAKFLDSSTTSSKHRSTHCACTHL